jgi:hypothetical protein
MKIRVLLYSAIFLMASPSSRAESSPTFEIWTGSFGNFSVISMAGSVTLQGGFMGTGIGTGVLTGVPNPSFGYHWKHGLEFIFTPSFNFVQPLRAYQDFPVNPITIVSEITGGVAYNFSSNIKNSSYLRFDLGAAILKNGDATSTNLLWNAHFGKRFALTNEITWVPALMFQMITTSPNVSLGLSAIPLQFSVLF